MADRQRDVEDHLLAVADCEQRRLPGSLADDVHNAGRLHLNVGNLRVGEEYAGGRPVELDEAALADFELDLHRGRRDDLRRSGGRNRRLHRQGGACEQERRGIAEHAETKSHYLNSISVDSLPRTTLTLRTLRDGPGGG